MDLIVCAIMAATFFSLLLLTASVIAQSVQKRKNELALLQAFGFSRLRVGMLIVVEATLLLLTGGVTGFLFASAGVFAFESLSGGMLVLPAFNPVSFGIGLLLMLGFGLVSGLFPVLMYPKSHLAQILSRH